MALAKDDPQIHMEDRFLEDPELDEQLEIYMDNKEAAGEYAKAKAKIVKRLVLFSENESLSDGQVVRCGVYAIKMTRRAGGGIQIPVWDKLVVGSVSAD